MVNFAVVTDVACPYCKAPVGQPCKTRSGNPVPYNHDSRRKALRKKRL